MHDELKALRESQAVLQREVTMQRGLEAQYVQRSALKVPMHRCYLPIAPSATGASLQDTVLRLCAASSTTHPASTTAFAGQGVAVARKQAAASAGKVAEAEATFQGQLAAAQAEAAAEKAVAGAEQDTLRRVVELQVQHLDSLPHRS